MVVTLFYCDRCGLDRWVPTEKIVRHPELFTPVRPDTTPVDTPYGPLKIKRHCPCGGVFDTEALPRCPHCRSNDWRPDPDGKDAIFD